MNGGLDVHLWLAKHFRTPLAGLHHTQIERLVNHFAGTLCPISLVV
jgi:hypothetical protein